QPPFPPAPGERGEPGRLPDGQRGGQRPSPCAGEGVGFPSSEGATPPHNGDKPDAAPGRLTTHVLDTARGRPGAGIRIALFRLEGEGRVALATAVTNADGRTDGPLLAGEALMPGVYELVFAVGQYFADFATAGGDPVPTVPFLDTVPVRFGVGDAGAHYHVPLLVSPWAYSTYRGS
ncbi:MAG: 5-hydroxyisourate hydrolase, partial [uncultured Thermomicrobiales bacterium]